MRTPVASSKFLQDVKRGEKRGKDLSKLRALIELLVSGTELPARYRDHALKGEWKTYRDAHIEPDWLLIYRITGETVELARTGTHADLFDR